MSEDRCCISCDYIDYNEQLHKQYCKLGCTLSKQGCDKYRECARGFKVGKGDRGAE